PAPRVRCSGAPTSPGSPTMPTQTHPIDARPSLWLIAAFMLIVGLGVLGMATQVQEPSTDGVTTEAVGQFADCPWPRPPRCPPLRPPSPRRGAHYLAYAPLGGPSGAHAYPWL